MKKKNVLALVCVALVLTGCGTLKAEQVSEEISVEEISAEEDILDEEVQEDTEEEEQAVNEDYFYLGDSGIPLLSEHQSALGFDLYFRCDGEVDPKADNNFVGNLTLVNGNNKVTTSFFLNIYTSNNCTRMFTDDNREYIYLEADSSNDYYDLFVFDITDGQAKFVNDIWETYVFIDELNVSSPDFSDLNNILLGDISQGFGTFYYYNYYKVGPDGMPEPKEEACTIFKVCSEKITSKKAMDFQVVDDEGKLTGDKKTVPAGSVYTPIRTDGRNWIDAQISDGTVVRIRIIEFGYDGTINGEYVKDLFNGLEYVG